MSGSFYDENTVYDELGQSETILAEVQAAAAEVEANAAAAAASETAAAASATTAASSEADAETAASSAATAATNAAASATSASNSATAAGTSAIASAASAAAASASETNAAASAATASSAATSAAASYDSFDDRYLGAKASDPSVDNDGNALLTGALYWNTAVNALKFYDGAAWQAYSPSSGAPSDVDYLVKTASAGLSAERVVTDNSAAGGLKFNWSTAGQVTSFLYASAADKFLYSTGADTWAEGSITAAGRALLDDADAAAQRTTLGLPASATTDTTNASNISSGTLAAARGGAGTVNGLMKANGSGVVSAAVSGTDYAPAPSGSSILKGNGSGGFANATAGTDYAPATSGSSILKGNGSGGTTAAAAGTDFMKPDTTSNLTAGFTAASYNAGTKSTGTFTPDPTLGNWQHYTNGGAHALAPPASPCSIVVECTNASAGALNTAGFDIVDGDTYSNSGTKKHIFYITKTNSISHLNVRYKTGS